MAKLPNWSENRIKRMQAKGRGTGTGSSYQPWLTVTDLSSRGNSRRVYSQKTGRVHHLFSNVEWNLFLLLEHDPNVVDIREQFPLERADTIAIAIKHGIKHPNYRDTTIPSVMTCDFLVTRRCGGNEVLEGYDCKRAEDAVNPRAIEKLEIQRAYFRDRNIPHFLVLHTMFPMGKIRNLEWIRSAHLQDDELEPYDRYYDDHCEQFLSELAGTVGKESLADFCANYDHKCGALPGTGLRVVRMLLAKGSLQADLNGPAIAEAPACMIRLATPEFHTAGGH